MVYRDDRDALLQRADALERERDEAKEEAEKLRAENEQLRAQVKAAPEPEPEPQPPPAPRAEDDDDDDDERAPEAAAPVEAPRERVPAPRPPRTRRNWRSSIGAGATVALAWVPVLALFGATSPALLAIAAVATTLGAGAFVGAPEVRPKRPSRRRLKGVPLDSVAHAALLRTWKPHKMARVEVRFGRTLAPAQRDQLRQLADQAGFRGSWTGDRFSIGSKKLATAEELEDFLQRAYQWIARSPEGEHVFQVSPLLGGTKAAKARYPGTR